MGGFLEISKDVMNTEYTVIKGNEGQGRIQRLEDKSGILEGGGGGKIIFISYHLPTPP